MSTERWALGWVSHPGLWIILYIYMTVWRKEGQFLRFEGGQWRAMVKESVGQRKAKLVTMVMSYNENFKRYGPGPMAIEWNPSKKNKKDNYYIYIDNAVTLWHLTWYLTSRGTGSVPSRLVPSILGQNFGRTLKCPEPVRHRNVWCGGWTTFETPTLKTRPKRKGTGLLLSTSTLLVYIR